MLFIEMGIYHVKKKEKNSGFFNFIMSHREKLVFYMCLGVHLSYLISFSFLHIWSLSAVNLISVLIYIVFLMLVISGKNSEKLVIAAYFEILIFCVISEILSHGCLEYFPFLIGIISGIVYLTPSYKNKHLVIQIIGIVTTLVLFLAERHIPESMFEKTYRLIQPYGKTYAQINLLITLCLIVYSAFFYEMKLTDSRKELDYNSTHDLLTGLYNRRFLYDKLKKSDNCKISVAILDIDHFKRINDSFGHDKGDEILVSVSGIISENTDGSSQIAVRWGGEEFVMYCSDNDTENLYNKVRDICSKISESVILPDSTRVTLTAGIASGNKDDFDLTVKQADEYLYSGKKNGRNCIVWDRNLK